MNFDNIGADASIVLRVQRLRDGKLQYTDTTNATRLKDKFGEESGRLEKMARVERRVLGT
jgi:predicted RNA-binding protein (virulence factor B family)